ncbi:unnamed protein product, partial [Ectocarpus sp. 13 AM-2016]
MVLFLVKVESMHQLQQQHVLGGGQSLSAGGANGSSSGSSTMQVVPQHYVSLMGSRRTSAEDFLSLLQDSEELQAREVPSMQDEEPDDSSQSQPQPQPQPQHALLPPPGRVPQNGGGGSSVAAHPTSTPHPPQEATPRAAAASAPAAPTATAPAAGDKALASEGGVPSAAGATAAETSGGEGRWTGDISSNFFSGPTSFSKGGG